MPLTRYELRNEYSLADPELYRAADKDDPEALLEGVAMAGLVGVLRQLGDLAEFAAEIFHNLHEEVMATAARGHGLALRVQQLEAEFPSVEKAFLSQTSHSLFLHNPGVDWHPHFRLDQSLITQGDLPRFVMDSYEECRGPPRLFLLDKFDIAGAGACLKRYTDPSFFRAEFSSSEAAKEELKREKKARKIKKKGSRWRTGDNAEVTASHSKLHQLLLEERCQSQNNVHTHHVKLKRRHSSNSLVNSTSGRSYMERFLSSRSPDRKFVCESSAVPSRLKMGSCNVNGLVPERKILEKSPDSELLIRDRSLLPSHSQEEEEVLKPSLDELEVDVIEERNSNTLLKSFPEIELRSIASTYKVEDKKEIDVNAKGNIEASAEGYHSDDANSEIDNYTDALTTMDSELETDTESKPKNELGFKTERKCMVSEVNEEQKELQAQFVASHSVGSSLASEDGNFSLEKRRLSSSYSDTHSNSTENMPSDGDLASTAHPFTVSKSVDFSSKNLSEIRNASVRTPKHAVQNGSCNEVSEIPSYSPSFRDYEMHAENKLKHAAPIGGCDELSEVPSYVPSFRDYENHAEDASKHTVLNDSVTSPGASRNEDQLINNLNSVIMSSDIIDSVIGPENDGTAGHHLSFMTNVSDIPTESRPDDLQSSDIIDASCDISGHLSNNLGPTHRENDDDIEETTPAAAVAANDSPNETKMDGKLYSPDSVLLSTETELYSLVEEELEARSGTRWAPECRSDFPTDDDMNDVRPDGTVMDLEKVLHGERSEYFTSGVNYPETDDLREQKDSKVTDQTASPKSDTKEVSNDDSEVEVSCNNVESSMSDRSGFEMETSCKTMEFNKSEHEAKDGHATNRIHFNSSINQRTDISRDISDAETSVSAAEAPLQVADPETIDIRSEDIKNTVVYLSPIGSSNWDLNQEKLEISGASDANISTKSNTGNEVENQPVAAHFDYNTELCPPRSEIVDDAHDPLMVEYTQTRSDCTEGTEVLLSTKESDQKKELKQPLTSNLLEAGALREGQDLHSSEDNMWSLLPNVESTRSSYDECELAQSPNNMYSDECSIAPSKSSPLDILCQPADVCCLSSKTCDEFQRSDSSVLPLQPMCQGTGLHADASNQQPLDPQPQRPLLDISLPDNNVMQDSMEEVPPLPPLPPMQWRIGKFRHDSPTSGGEMIPPNFNSSSPFSAGTVDWIDQQGFPTFHGELAHPMNPFLHPTSDAKIPEHGFSVLEMKMVHPSLSPLSPVVPAVEFQNVQLPSPILEGTIMKPQNSFSAEGDLQHDSSNSGEEPQDIRLNPITAVSTTDNLNIQSVSSISPDELAYSADSSTPVQHRDNEMHGCETQTVEGELKWRSKSSADIPTERSTQPQISIAPTTSEIEMHGYETHTVEGELKWQSNSSADIPTVDYGKPNGSLKSRLSRPRDPLIEAVASHDKSNLRKVAERIIPQIGAQADERNSLLEQIRAKSFSLKPAVATRPSVQGPKTNLKVVAILEKANAIRQALAGSDEDDDDDSWSDS